MSRANALNWRDEPAKARRTVMRSYWSPAECQVLREHYLSGGLAACLPLLPGKTASSAMAKAARMGLKRQQTHGQPKPSSESIDAEIRRLYAKPLGKGELARAASRLGRARQWIYYRACVIGAKTTPERLSWRPEEIAILEAAEGLGLGAIQRRLRAAGFRRTKPAISSRMFKLDMTTREDDPNLYSASQLAQTLSVCNKTVLRWIETGKLKAEREPASPKDRTAWRIQRKDIRRFLIDHVGVWDHRRVEQWRLIDLLTGLPGSR